MKFALDVDARHFANHLRRLKAMQDVHLSAADGRARLIGTSDKMELSITIGAATGTGVAALPYARVRKLANLNKGPITIQCTNGQLNLRGVMGNARSTVHTYNRLTTIERQFAKKRKRSLASLPLPTFHKHLRCTDRTIAWPSPDCNLEHAVRAVRFESNGSKLVSVATDGFVLSMFTSDCKGLASTFTLQGAAIDIANQMGGDGRLKVCSCGPLLLLSTSGESLALLPAALPFPEYKRILGRLSAKPTTTITIDNPAELVRAIEYVGTERPVVFRVVANGTKLSVHGGRYDLRDEPDEIRPAFSFLDLAWLEAEANIDARCVGAAAEFALLGGRLLPAIERAEAPLSIYVTPEIVDFRAGEHRFLLENKVGKI